MVKITDQNMQEIAQNKEYKQWLRTLKTTIRTSQLKAAVAVNSQLILLYFELGRMIVEKQESSKWGSKLIPQIASDLKKELPEEIKKELPTEEEFNEELKKLK